MKKLLVTIFVLIFGLVFLGSSPVFAGNVGDIEALNKRIEALEAKAEKRGGLGDLGENLSFSGAIELDYSYTNPRETTVVGSDSTSELDIGTVQLGVEAQFHECVTGNFVLKGEDLDTDDRVFWDEATITIQKEGFPLYFVGGRRGQPFGVFNSHLISDPITKELEIVETGATLGFTPDFLGLDISATAYKGETIGIARNKSGGYTETDDVESYIASISTAPVEGLTLSAYYNSEPGDGARNKTAGGAIEYQIGMFTFDGEYIGALNKEKPGDSVEQKESAWFGAIACQVTDPLEIAARYEAYDDDISGDTDGTLEKRYSVGANYKLFEKDNFVTTVMVEYRGSHNEKPAGSTDDDTVDEFFAKLAIEF
ncbi:MAG: LbtU family siderophore porin [Thermodesulfobacteriota bacterium]|nr:LbtU family siderophore porin [Thermodesulfobacteriota bacterium]